MLVSATAAARPWSAGFDETIGYGGHADELSYGWRLESGGFFRLGAWQLTVAAPMQLAVHSSDPARDSDQLLGFALASRVAYHVALPDHTDAFVAAGLGHEWLLGDSDVTRPCRLTGACLAGFTMETPSYEGWFPELRVGVGPRAPWPDGMFAGSIDLIVDAHHLDVPPRGLRDLSILGAITLTIGKTSR